MDWKVVNSKFSQHAHGFGRVSIFNYRRGTEVQEGSEMSDPTWKPNLLYYQPCLIRIVRCYINTRRTMFEVTTSIHRQILPDGNYNIEYLEKVNAFLGHFKSLV